MLLTRDESVRSGCCPVPSVPGFSGLQLLTPLSVRAAETGRVILRAMRIYVDVDDVLSETVRSMLVIAAERFGRRRRYDDIREFDLRVSFEFDEETHHRFMQAVHEPAVLRSFDVIPGAIEVLDEWQRAGHEICIVTGRPPTSERVTRDWLEQRGIPFSSLVCVDKYGRHGALHGGASRRLEALATEKYAFAIEDSVTIARFLAGLGTPVALLSRPWNLNADVGDGVFRVADWEQVSACFASHIARRAAPAQA